MVRIGCAAHARRKFRRALRDGECRAIGFIARFRRLYRIERETKDLTPEHRHQIRQQQAPPIWADLRAQALALQPQLLPQSSLGKAVSYFLNEYEALTGYLASGLYEIDNNLVENSIRVPAVGRRYAEILPRQSLARWVELAADWLRPVYEEIRCEVVSRGYVQVDETPIRYLDPGRGQTAQGYLWTCALPRGDVVYRWETSRAAECLERVLPADFTGVVQCDGYAAYDCFVGRHPKPIVLAACWAHARRKFFEAQSESPRLAAWFLCQIQLLYCVESRLRATRAGPQLRQAGRASESRMVVERLHRVMLKIRDRLLPKSLLGQAISYALGQWDGLKVYLEDGRVEIDSNTVENAIRPTAIGKKNWLFVGAADAGQRGAILYTIVESCRRWWIDPYHYLRDVLTRPPSLTNRQVTSITPKAWLKVHRNSLPAAA